MGILAVALAATLGVCWLIAALDERRVAARMRREQRAVHRDLAGIERVTGKIELASKVRVMEGMLNGRRCKSCNEVKPRDGFVQIGDDHIGRPIEVCGDCRGILGDTEGGDDAKV